MSEPATPQTASPGQVTDLLVTGNGVYAEHYHDPDVPLRPTLKVAVVTCMDARLDAHRLLGLELGQAHVIRNAGGVVSEDMIRSLAISQRKLGTRHVVLVHHTDCGMQTFTDDDFRREMEAEIGIRPSWAVESFTDVEADVRQCMARVRTSPFLTLTEELRGFVYDVHSGALTEVM